MDNKSELRIKAKTIRKSLDIKKISETVVSKVLKQDYFVNAKNIMIFYPLLNEIDLLELTKISGKNFYLPKIDGDNLLACPYKNGDKLIEASFKTNEPTSNPVNPEILDLIFVPALMVDKNNFRLGYGKGFYDRFLNKTNAKTVVPISEKLIIEKLPTELHDLPVEIVISG